MVRYDFKKKEPAFLSALYGPVCLRGTGPLWRRGYSLGFLWFCLFEGTGLICGAVLLLLLLLQVGAIIPGCCRCRPEAPENNARERRRVELSGVRANGSAWATAAISPAPVGTTAGRTSWSQPVQPTGGG